MPPFGDNRNRIGADQTQALSHPVRLGILTLFTRDTNRSLAAVDLWATLVADDAVAFEKYDVGQVHYHRTRLQHAQLLPIR